MIAPVPVHCFSITFIPAFMVVLVTCKNEDLIRNEGARELTSLYIDFSDAQGLLTLQSVVESRRNSPNQAFMVVLVTCKNEDPIKNEGARVLKRFSPL